MSQVADSILNDPITKHLREQPTTLIRGQTVGQSLEYLRANPPTSRVLYLYVTDIDGRLCGVVPTRRMLLTPTDKLIDDIMVKSVVSVSSSATVLEACEFFTLHKLLAFPVVDKDRRIVGVVDVELYTGEIEDLERRVGNDDVFQLVGVHFDESNRNRYSVHSASDIPG